jgi:hypothetical protein
LSPGTFFELHFQNPEKETSPIIKTVELQEGQHIIDVTTEPVMFVKDKQWYEIEVFIFSDKTKQTKLGVHYQMVKAVDSELELSSPTRLYQPSPMIPSDQEEETTFRSLRQQQQQQQHQQTQRQELTVTGL